MPDHFGANGSNPVTEKGCRLGSSLQHFGQSFIHTSPIWDLEHGLIAGHE
jgi:hypothetical protein